MASIWPLKCPVKDYHWGSREAIPRLTGRPADGHPWAELWMGAHPQGPGLVVADGGPPVGLDTFVTDRAEEILGPAVLAEFGARLPFLFKLLAAAEPLSIQCHPSAVQAAAGFAREEQAGIARTDAKRNYRDPYHKPELLVALEPFDALVGFRAFETIRESLHCVESRLGPWHRQSEPLSALLLELLGLEPLAVEQLVDVVLTAGFDLEPEAGKWVRSLATTYPGDGAVLAPLFMNFVRLAPGEAMFLPAGQLHSYLHGTGLELMAASDNVVRGGLSNKHVDRDELLQVGVFEESSALRVPRDSADANLSIYRTSAREFELSCIEVNGAPYGRTRGPQPGPEILLALGGEGTRMSLRTDSGEEVSMGAGDVALVTSRCAGYSVSGSGSLWLAGVPSPNHG